MKRACCKAEEGEVGTQEKDSWMNTPLTVHRAHPSQYNAIVLMIEGWQFFYSSLRNIADLQVVIPRFGRSMASLSLLS